MSGGYGIAGATGEGDTMTRVQRWPRLVLPAAVGLTVTALAVPAGAAGTLSCGGSDDTAAVQSALDGGGQVTIPAGEVCAHSGVLTIGTAGTHLSGPGTLLATTDDDSVQVRADDVTVDGGLVLSRHSTSRGLDDASHHLVLRAAGTTVQGITVDGSHGAGIIAEGASNYLIDGVTVQNTMADAIHNCCGSHDGTVRNSTVISPGDDGFAVVSYASDPVTHNITIEHPVLRGAQTHGRGVSVVGGQSVKVTDVDLDNSAAAAIYIADEKEFATSPVSGVTVSGGRITRANQDRSTVHGAALLYASTGSVSNVDIGNLTISDTNLATPADLRVVQSGGSVSGVSFHDIAVSGGPKDVTQGTDGVASVTNVGAGVQVPAGGSGVTQAPVPTPAPSASPAPSSQSPQSPAAAPSSAAPADGGRPAATSSASPSASPPSGAPTRGSGEARIGRPWWHFWR